MAAYYQLEGQSLNLDITGERVDALSLGVITISLQRIVEKVTHDLLYEERVLAPGWKWAVYPSRWFQPEYPRFAQLELTGAKKGSFDSSWVIAVIATLNDPHVIAILDNLAANVIWAIGMAGLKGVSSTMSDRIQVPSRLRRKQRERDPHQIEALVRDIVLIAEQNPSIKSIKLQSNESVVTLDLEFYRRHNVSAQ